jgi:ribosomal protein S18 acetylase RimI-like enzyme
MNRLLRIILMKTPHIRACGAIVASSPPWSTLGETIDFRRFIALKQAYIAIRQDAGGEQVAGFIIFSADPVFARGGYLRAIGVSPAFRRMGIGSALLLFAEKTTSRQAMNLYLCVSSFNRNAQRFYRERGYRKAGSLPGLTSPDSSEYIYWKRLKPLRTRKKRSA